MESSRDGTVGDISDPATLKNEKNNMLKSDSAPALTFFNGRVWMAYRTKESHIVLACRVDSDKEPQGTTYQEFRLSSPTFQAKSDEPPTICGFNGRLYVFWKDSTVGKGVIRYQSTEDGGSWSESGTKEIAGSMTKSAPAAVVHRGYIHVATLADSDTPLREIRFHVSYDGNLWNQPIRQRIAPTPAISAVSPYPPSFSIVDNAMTMFWGAGENDEHAVYYATVDPWNAPWNVGGVGVVDTRAVVTPQKIDNGKWHTAIGNAVAYRGGQQWIFTTTRDDKEISVATAENFDVRASLSARKSKVKSPKTCGVCIIPGVSGQKYRKSWRIVVIWREASNSASLYQAFIDIETT